MGPLRGGIAVVLAALALAPAAQAAQRYAAPAGSGTECTAGKPCSLKEAVSKAKANDEVIVTTGAYTVTEIAVLGPEALGAYVHGDFTGPPPTITGSVSGYLIGSFTPGSRIAYLDVSNTANFSGGVLCGSGTTVERVRASGKGPVSYGLQLLGSCTARDSVARAEGESSFGVLVSGENNRIGVVRNLTSTATGVKADGLRAYNNSFSAGSHLLSIRNSIFSGSEFDLHTVFGAFGATVAVDVAHSNFDTSKAEAGTIAPGPGNQSAAPLFLDAAAGDYREAPGSPTIDAGSAEGVLAGENDYDGNPRALGPAPDIGAFEVVPPAVPPATPGEITALAISPKAFRTANAGGATISAKKRARAPIGATVTYSLSAAATVNFTVERKLPGRKVGKRCVKPTKANRKKKRCARFKPVKGSFTHSGAAGANRFKLSGRTGGRALKPGGYRLLGKTASASKTASFRVVK